jgi:RimJ/RimL family protein N-acetyltransferase
VERESRRKDRWPRTPGPGYRRPVSTILETERLRLRHYHRDLSDLSALHAIQSDPHHMRFYPHPFSEAESREWIERRLQQYDQLGFSLWAAEDRATGEFLGNVGPTPQEVDGVEEIELGWSVTPTRSGQGIATEAGLACREWCFAHLDVDHLISLVRPENVASRRVAEKIGMHVWKETDHAGILHRVYRIDRDEVAPPNRR